MVDVGRCRVRMPSVRESWLKGGPGTAPERRGKDRFMEVEWDRALDLVAAELDRVRTDVGNEAIYAGSYGWASAGRFHHAPTQLHRFMNSIGGYTRSVNTYSLAAAGGHPAPCAGNRVVALPERPYFVGRDRR